MVKNGLNILSDNYQSVLDALKFIGNRDVLVGIPSDRATRDDGAEINNAELGYIQSYGGAIRIPEHTVTLNRKVKPDGSFANDGRFVKAAKANFSTDHVVSSYTVNIPPRPFLDIGIANAKKAILEYLQQAARAALSGERDSAVRYMEMAGIAASNAAKKVIHDGTELTPLSPRTLAARRSRGRTGTKPLYGTGSLVRSITYVVRNKNATS